MDETEKVQKITALREELRNGRVNKSSEDTRADGGSDDTEAGATFQTTGREVNSLVRNRVKINASDRQSPGYRRSTQTGAIGGRQPDRRPGEDNGSFDRLSTESDSRTVGRIFTDDPVKARKIEPDAPQGAFDPNAPAQKKKPDPKPKQAKAKTPIFPKGHVYSKQEAIDKQESLVSALESNFDSLDEYLWLRQKSVGINMDEQPVWSDVDTEEVEALTRLLLRGAQQNELVAVAVDGILDSADYISVATVFGPRIKRTVDIMKATRKPRAKRTQHETEHQ